MSQCNAVAASLSPAYADSTAAEHGKIFQQHAGGVCGGGGIITKQNESDGNGIFSSNTANVCKAANETQFQCIEDDV